MQNLIEMLKRHEGEVVTNGRHLIYKCSAGHWTIGIGRNVDVNGGLGLSDEEVDFLLEKDIERVIKELSTEYVWFSDLDDVRKDAMIDISFNLGATRLRKVCLSLGCDGNGRLQDCRRRILRFRLEPSSKGPLR